MYQSYANNMGYSPTQMRLNQMEQMYPQYNNQMIMNIAKQNPQMNMAMQMMGGVKDKKGMKEVKMMQQMYK